MFSLPELSRVTGVPMPIILRLSQEHPRELPAVGSGSQVFFPAGVIPTLQRLYGEERCAQPSAGEHRRGLFTLSRARKEQAEAERHRRESELQGTEAAAATGREGEPPTERSPEADLSDLEEHLIGLERRTRTLTDEVAQALEWNRRPYKGEVPGMAAG